MASSSASGGASIAALTTSIYDACLPFQKENSKFVFHQSDILDFEIIPNDDPHILLQVIQKLMDDRLFKVVNDSEGTGWILRTIDEAKKYRSLNAEQEIVYALIDESGTEGLWSKTIKVRTALHDAVYRQAIKALETKGMIQEMKSVEHPTRKMYIRAGLRASERATGGPWFSDGELDEEFILMAGKILQIEISRWSFYGSRVASPKQAKKVVKKMTPEEIKATRAKGLGKVKSEDESAGSEPPAKRQRILSLDAFPVGFTGYRTLEQLTQHVDKSDAFQQTLTSADISQLIEMLIYDDKIEKVEMSTGETGYRALRKTIGKTDDVEGVLNEVPCGRCPVFDLCEEGGPVGPSSCEYFNEWLKL